jgi:hypothetical protein
MKRILIAIALGVSAAVLVFADGGGMGGGMGSGGMSGGSGMLVVADDGSLLVTEMGMGGGMMGGGSAQEVDRELINLSSSGEERWRVSFDDGWPMMPVTDGDLVVLSLADDWWWDHGGGMMGGKTFDGDEEQGHATLVGIDLATGAEAWRLELEGDMISIPQFAPDGYQLYLTVRVMDGDHVGGRPMRQGDAAGSGMLTSSTVVAVDRNGNVLWSLDLDDDGGMGGPMGGGGS